LALILFNSYSTNQLDKRASSAAKAIWCLRISMELVSDLVRAIFLMHTIIRTFFPSFIVCN
jgi:hypothetical protein